MAPDSARGKSVMHTTLSRRRLVASAAGAAIAARLPAPAIAEANPVRVGLLTIKTGPLAPAGIQMEQGTVLFFKDRDRKIAGRQVELLVADTGGNPAGAKTKAQELIERDNVDLIFGPLAAFELLAISSYVAGKKVPILSLAAAEDMTQRKPNPYFVRASATSAQAMHPLADFAAKELKYKTVITVSDDFAFGYEQMGGFQRVFEDEGGRVVKKLWPPLTTPDYTPYLAQLGGVDAVVQGFAGANPGKFMQQYKDAGLKLPLLGGEGAGDDALLKSFGDEAIGLISASPYTSDFDSPSNKRLVAEMLRDNGNLPGVAAAGLYINGMIAEAALEAIGGKTDDKDALIKALRAVSLTDSPRGPFHFDDFGNVVGNIFIRRCEKKDGKLVNTTIKTYPNVSQFWTYDEKWFLAQPVYSRDYPPLKS
jgi:branched-chain amino acid transport system substrate-binding protein